MLAEFRVIELDLEQVPLLTIAAWLTGIAVLVLVAVFIVIRRSRKRGRRQNDEPPVARPA